MVMDRDSYSLYKPVRRKFKRLHFIVMGMNDQYEVDLADMQKLKDKNDGVAFLLVIIDIFTHYLGVEPLKTKTKEDVIKAFKKVFKYAKNPKRLRTDRGGEFTGQKVQDYLDSINVEHWTSHNDEMKANYTKHVIHTLKTSLWGYMRASKNYRYMDALQKLVDFYNNTEHDSIGMKPSKVTTGEVEHRLWWHQYKPMESYSKSHLRRKIPFAFQEGDHIHISQIVETFVKGTDEKWTQEIFIVRHAFQRFGIKKYRLRDLKGEEVNGMFHEGELQKVSYLEYTFFKIEKVINKRGKGN